MMAWMFSLVGFVDYSFEHIVVPAHRIPVCHEAVQAWAASDAATLADAMRSCHHDFDFGDSGDLELTCIRLEVWWPELESLYQLLAPFMQAEGKVYCSDEENRHICYHFRQSRVYRIEGRVVFDGPRLKL